ncbi:T9SS type A sorting domain-containing protein [Formosa sp. PL04]|uniref:T9SS type A sorting domain-containing protein n=1 Tax=Formosa sp. PL04 TaxID=3081755 RepID=UPI002981E053|nr:T9SS type A sorting domain-containing protein [Formosa sp. PL04]MDW5289687.1 T9SS type A sorting domain-containing protein [Formosa sp. PL04]
MKKNTLNCVIILIASLFSINTFSQSLNEKFCNVFPTSGVFQQEGTPMSFTNTYSPSGSSWSLTQDESVVFQNLMTYNHPTDADKSYELRIGKGGQIYSFITSAGETIPPQWRNPATYSNPNIAPWVDEVWQIVGVDITQDDRQNNQKYFIHQAGVYLLDSEIPDQKPFYSPQIAEYYDSDNQEYTTVNWGQHAHTNDNLTAGFTSSILYYTKYKNLGNGLIQVDNLLYNFGTDVIHHMNVPWGGIRTSTYGYWYVSDAENNFTLPDQVYNHDDYFAGTETTSGAMVFTNAENGNGSSLGIMVNNDDGTTRIKNVGGTANRNYTLHTAIRNEINLKFGDAIRIRNYFIVDGSVTDIQSQISNLNLQENTFFGFDNKTKKEVDETNYYFDTNGVAITAEETTANNGLNLTLQPHVNSYPLFLIKGLNDANNTEYRITSDLYTFSKKPYDGITENIDLIGFSDTKMRITNFETATVSCAGDSYTFPDGSSQNIYADTVYFSEISVDADGFSIMTQTTVNVNSTLELVPSSQIDNETATSNTEISVSSGQDVILQAQVNNNGDISNGTGTWSWTGPDNVTNSGSMITLSAISISDIGTYTFFYTQGCDTVNQIFNVIVDNYSPAEPPVLDLNNVWYHNYYTNEFNALETSPVASNGILEKSSSTPTVVGNPSTIVSKFTRGNSIQSFIKFDLTGNLSNSENAIFKIRVYTATNAVAANNNLRIILKQDNDTSTQLSQIVTVTEFDKWVDYTFDMSNITFKADSYNELYLFFVSPDTSASANGSVYYFDAFQGPESQSLSIDSNSISKFNIYPNPTDGLLKFNLKAENVNVYNVFGQVVNSYKNVNEINVFNYSNGLYFLDVTLENGQKKAIRFVKK